PAWSRPVVAPAMVAPHDEQKRASSLSFEPQIGQFIDTPSVLAQPRASCQVDTGRNTQDLRPARRAARPDPKESWPGNALQTSPTERSIINKPQSDHKIAYVQYTPEDRPGEPPRNGNLPGRFLGGCQVLGSKPSRKVTTKPSGKVPG